MKEEGQIKAEVIKNDPNNRRLMLIVEVFKSKGPGLMFRLKGEGSRTTPTTDVRHRLLNFEIGRAHV